MLKQVEASGGDPIVRFRHIGRRLACDLLGHRPSAQPCRAETFSGGIMQLPLPMQTMQNTTVPSVSALEVPKYHPCTILVRITPIRAIAGEPTKIVLFRFPITTDRLYRLIWTWYAVLTLIGPDLQNPTPVPCDRT